MALINRAGQEISAKVVYYGPGLSGKTTNLEVLFRQVPEDSRGKMISMKTRTDRTLFFDLLPLSAESIHDFQVRILLYTVPGQVYYNATRRLVLKGVDAVVFVADSQRGKMQENLESLENLRSNLADMDLKLDDLPWVIQYNKRDLPDILSVEELDQALNPGGVPSICAVAPRGDGVHETLQGISDHLRPELQKLVENEMGDQLRSTLPSHQGQAESPSLVVPEVTDPGDPAPIVEAPPTIEPQPLSEFTETEPTLATTPPPVRRSGLDLDKIPDPPVIEMPAAGEMPSVESESHAEGLESLIEDDPRQSLREVETTIHASPLRSLSDPEPDPDRPIRSYDSLLESTEPETPVLDLPRPDTTAVEEKSLTPEPPSLETESFTPEPATTMPEPEIVVAPLPETPVAEIPEPSAPEKTDTDAEVLELVVPRRLLRDGQITLRIRLEDEPAAPAAPEPAAWPSVEQTAPKPSPPDAPTSGRVALRNGELVSIDGDEA